MLRLLSSLIGHPVVAQREGGPIGVIREAVADAKTGKIIAYRTTAGYLATADILGYAEGAMVVADAEVLQPEEDLVRVKQLKANRTGLLGLTVRTERGRRLGKVNDVLLETDGSFVTRIHVRPGFWQRLTTGERIIPRELVVRMTATEVIVRYDEKAPTRRGAEPEIAQ